MFSRDEQVEFNKKGVAEQKADIEKAISAIENNWKPSTYREDVDLINGSKCQPDEKLDYLKRLAPYVRGEDMLWCFSRKVMKIGRDHPEAQPKMFECLKSFVDYPQSGSDLGAPLSDMYRDLRDYFRDTPNYAQNILDLINAENSAKRFEKMNFNFLGRFRDLNVLLSDYPQFARPIYDTYKSILDIHKEQRSQLEEFDGRGVGKKEMELLGRLIPIMEKDPNNGDVISDIKITYNNLKAKYGTPSLINVAATRRDGYGS